jgi:hypothetical protein
MNIWSMKWSINGMGRTAAFFKVRADDGNLYILRHQGVGDEWSLESFRRLR